MTDELRLWPGYWSRIAPERTAYVLVRSDGSQSERVTYRQLDQRSNQIARVFREKGLAPGDFLAILGENHPRYLEICWAAQRSGLRYVPINWHLLPEEIEYIANDCGAKLLVASAAFGAQVAELAPRLPQLRARLAFGGDVPGFERLEALAAAQSTEPLLPEQDGGDMIYTSGSTGRPKGGKRATTGRHPGAPNPALGLFALFGLDEHSTYLSPGAPLYHAAPLRFCMSVLRLGGTCVVLDRFEPLAALRAIETHGVTHSQWVPTMFVRLLRLAEAERKRFDLSSHRVAIHAAAPCPVAVKEALLEWWGPIVYEYYGGSEGGGITYVTPQEWLAHRGSVGRAVIGSVHIVGEDGAEQPTGEPGVIYFEGGAPIEYHNDPEKTKRAYHERGWSTIGDVGYKDADGFLYLTDRKDFMIIVGGVNIYPQEAENVLIAHPKVVDVAVFGVPNAEWGEEVKAVVQPADPREAGPALEAELLEFCHARLARQKCPRTIDFAAELPRTPAGKLYKRRLRDPYWAGHETRIV